MEEKNGRHDRQEVSLLLIEDDRGIAGLYRQRLQLEGFTVTLATNGESGLAAAVERVPDVIVLDVRLPGLSGMEVLERVRKDRRTRQVPVMVLTNWEDGEARTRAMKLGARDFLVKSAVRPGELADRIRDWLASEDAQRVEARR